MAELSVLTIAPKKNDPPFHSPYVHIYLSTYSTGDNGKILMSPQLINDAEIDYEVDSLIKQLEKVRKKAKKELNKKI